MQPEERNARLYTASSLLMLLKLHGGSSRRAAQFLGVSATTVSNWLSVKETESRGQGTPSDEHLRKLVVLVARQVRECLGAVCYLTERDVFRLREQVMLTRALAPHYERTARHMQEQSEHWGEMLADLRRMAEKYGPRSVDVTLAPLSSLEWGTSDPPVFNAADTVNLVDLFSRLEITDDEINAGAEELEQFFKEENRKVLLKLVNRLKKQKTNPASEE